MSNDILLYFQKVLTEAGLDKVYVGELPTRSIDAVAIKPVQGYNSMYYFGDYVANEPLIEIQIRHRDFYTGQYWSDIAKTSLDKLVNPDENIALCIQVGSPGYLGADSNGFGEWHTLFHVTYFERSGLNG